MIRRIRLQHWRAYDHLDLTLTRPVTFLVAPNGVGKSSLVEAVRFGLLGIPADRSLGHAVRGGFDTASVSLVVSLHDRDDIEVTRTLRRNGAVTFTATMDGQKLSESDYENALADAWTADISLLDALIFGPSTSGKTTGFPIRDHLAAVFGVDSLLSSAAELESRRYAIATQIKSLRQDLSGAAEAIEQVRRDVNALEASTAAAERDREAAARLVTDLEAVAEHATAWQQYRDAAEAYRSRTHELIASMADTVAVTDDDPRASVVAAQEQIAEALEASVAATADAKVSAARRVSATDLLMTATDQCPTCLRPLSEHEREVALAAHGRGGGGAREEIERYEQRTARLRREVEAIARFSKAFAELRPPTEPEYSDPGTHALTELRNARERTADSAQVHGGLAARLEAARHELERLQTAAVDQAMLVRLAKEDLLLEVAQRSVAKVADRYLAERVEPLTTEIGHRWKLLFGTDGLKLGPDGQLRLGNVGIDLALSDLSGGERATALLITRVMLAASATRASTLWLDEPLEHLDPVRRAGVAQTLVHAVQAGTIDQIVVTTYEEGLARRLEATAPDVVQLTYVRSTSDQYSA
jgi:DNA repair exonuclease SbcCD ATPase subunit